MDFIVAVDAQWGIGRNGTMLFHLPKDLAFFKRTTEGHIILMGRKTFESLPKGALPHRVNVVLTRQSDYEAPGAQVIQGLEELEAIEAFYPDKKVFLCGGGELYRHLLERCDGGFMTRLGKAAAAADTYFPNLDILPNWEKADCLESGVDGEIPYEIFRYERRTDHG